VTAVLNRIGGEAVAEVEAFISDSPIVSTPVTTVPPGRRAASQLLARRAAPGRSPASNGAG
jgi:hypothetical protein